MPRNCSVRGIPEAVEIQVQGAAIFIGREILSEYGENFLSLGLLVSIVIYSHGAISVLLDVSQGTKLP